METGAAVGFLGEKKMELMHLGYTIMDSLAYKLDVGNDILPDERFGFHDGLKVESFNDLEYFVDNSFNGEEFLRGESNRDVWSPITNVNDEFVDKAARDEGKERYTSTPKMLMEYIETKDNLWVSKQREFLDL